MVDSILLRDLLKIIFDYCQYEDAIKLSDEWFFTAPERPLVTVEQIKDVMEHPEIFDWPSSESYYFEDNNKHEPEYPFSSCMIVCIVIGRPGTKIYKTCPLCLEYYQLNISIESGPPNPSSFNMSYEGLLAYNFKLSQPPKTRYFISNGHAGGNHMTLSVCPKCTKSGGHFSPFSTISFVMHWYQGYSDTEKLFRNFLVKIPNIEY